jgi:hypothetical protein
MLAFCRRWAGDAPTSSVSTPTATARSRLVDQWERAKVGGASTGGDHHPHHRLVRGGLTAGSLGPGSEAPSPHQLGGASSYPERPCQAWAYHSHLWIAAITRSVPPAVMMVVALIAKRMTQSRNVRLLSSSAVRMVSHFAFPPWASQALPGNTGPTASASGTGVAAIVRVGLYRCPQSVYAHDKEPLHALVEPWLADGPSCCNRLGRRTSVQRPEPACSWTLFSAIVRCSGSPVDP